MKKFHELFAQPSYVFEVNQFLQDGYYQSELGDTMVNCLSNALGVNVILFSDNGTPMQAIRPSRTCKIDKPICLCHSSEGTGHYDTAAFLRSRPRFKEEPNKHENYVSPRRVGRHIVFPRASVRPSVRPSVCPSVCHESCPLCNLKTPEAIFTKLHTNINQH